jgi:alanine transaminase
MLPNPQYPLYSAAVTEAGGTRINYNLDEGDLWGTDPEAIKVLAEAGSA